MFYNYKMSHTFVGRFKGDFFDQQDKARKIFLTSGTTLEVILVWIATTEMNGTMHSMLWMN